MEIVPSIMQECFIPIQYRFSPEAIKNCLQEVLSEGNINSQVSAPANNDYMTKNIVMILSRSIRSSIQLNITNQTDGGILFSRTKTVHGKRSQLQNGNGKTLQTKL